MTVTPKALADGILLTDSEVPIYTAPALTIAAVHSITLCNTDSSDRTVTLWIIPSGQTSSARYRVYTVMTVKANQTIQDDALRNLEPGDFISALADVTNKVTIRIDGAEIT